MKRTHDQIIAALESEIFSEDAAGNLVVEKVPPRAEAPSAAPVTPGKREGLESQASDPSRYRRAVQVKDDGELKIFKSRVVHGADLLLFLDYLRREEEKTLETVGEFVGTEIKKRGWQGVWQESKSYVQGQEVTHNGVRWFAIKDSPGKPGTPDSGWTMTEKTRR